MLCLCPGWQPAEPCDYRRHYAKRRLSRERFTGAYSAPLDYPALRVLRFGVVNDAPVVDFRDYIGFHGGTSYFLLFGLGLSENFFDFDDYNRLVGVCAFYLHHVAKYFDYLDALFDRFLLLLGVENQIPSPDIRPIETADLVFGR